MELWRIAYRYVWAVLKPWCTEGTSASYIWYSSYIPLYLLHTGHVLVGRGSHRISHLLDDLFLHSHLCGWLLAVLFFFFSCASRTWWKISDGVSSFGCFSTLLPARTKAWCICFKKAILTRSSLEGKFKTISTVMIQVDTGYGCGKHERGLWWW